MTVWKYDGIIKKVTKISYYFGVLKDLMQYHIHVKFYSQDLTGSGFLMGVPFVPPPSVRLFNVEKKQAD